MRVSKKKKTRRKIKMRRRRKNDCLKSCVKKPFRKCTIKNKSKRIDPGYEDRYRGWYDVQKCGRCQDYCRWVGHSGRGGDPKKRTYKKRRGKGKSWWSCWLADASEGQTAFSTNKKWKDGFDYNRCTKEGNISHEDNVWIKKSWTFGGHKKKSRRKLNRKKRTTRRR